MNRPDKPESDRCWAVERSGVAGLTPATSYRRDGRALRARDNWEEGPKGAQSIGVLGSLSNDPANLSDPKRMESCSVARREHPVKVREER